MIENSVATVKNAIMVGNHTLMTRRHCKSKKNLVTKFDDIRRDFAKAVNHLMETGNVEAGGVV